MAANSAASLHKCTHTCNDDDCARNYDDVRVGARRGPFFVPLSARPSPCANAPYPTTRSDPARWGEQAPTRSDRSVGWQAPPRGNALRRCSDRTCRHPPHSPAPPPSSSYSRSRLLIRGYQILRHPRGIKRDLIYATRSDHIVVPIPATIVVV